MRFLPTASRHFAFLELPPAEAYEGEGYERYAAAVALMLNSLPSRVIVVAKEERIVRPSEWVEILTYDPTAAMEKDPISQEPSSGHAQSEVMPVYRYHFDFDDDLWGEKIAAVANILSRRASKRKERIFRSDMGRFLVHPPPGRIIS